MNSNLEKVEPKARTYFGDVSPAHDWLHVQRVYRTAETLAREEGADVETVRLAALLHDVGRAREDRGEIDDHAAWGAREAEAILRELGYGENLIEAVAHCVRAHRYSTAPEPRTLEAKVLADADNLDALGATGIARVFTYGGEREQPIADPDLPVEDDDTAAWRTSLNHVRKKILDLEDRMYTTAGEERAADRHAFVVEFVERFEDEMAGRK